MSNSLQNIDSSKKQFKLMLAGYVYPVLPLCGLIILSGLILVHILRNGAALSTIGKTLYLFLILVAAIFILGGLWSKTKTGFRIIASAIMCTEDSIVEIRQQMHFRILESILVMGVFASLFLFSADTKIGVFNLDAARYFNDTPSYVSTGSYSLLDSNFWVSERPFTLPLLYKMIGYTPHNFTDQGEMEQVARTQLVISLITWALLALSVSLLMEKMALKFLSYAVITLVGASLNITMWDRLMLSESLSISLFVLFLAFLILLAKIWMTKKELAVGLQIVLVMSVIVIAVLYSFTRNTNPYFLLSLAGLLILGLLFRSIRRHKLIAYYVAIMLSFFAIFGIQNVIMNKTSIYVSPLRDVFIFRFFPDKDKLAYLTENGMPYDQRFSYYVQLGIRQIREQLLIDDPVGLFNTWIKDHGKQVLFTYMLSHPGYTFVAPLGDMQTMLSGDVSYFRKTLSPTPLRLSILTEVFYPQSPLSPLLIFLFFGISIFLALKRPYAGYGAALNLTIYITAILILLIVWNSDPIELPRHTLQAALQLRLASWLCILFLIENLWTYLDKIKRYRHDHTG